MDTLGAALEREHREIDSGIEAFASTPDAEHRVKSLTRAMDGLRRHIYLEEEFVFPALRQAGLMAPVFVMLREHGQMWQTLDAMEAELGTGLPDQAVPGALSERCKELAGQLESHNSKEEPILYPQVDRVLTPEEGDQLAAFLESGRMPDGWVCSKART